MGISPNLTPCEQIWDYINVQDVARALLLIAEKGHNGRTYPLGSGTGRPLKEFVEDIQSIISPRVKVNFGTKEYYPHQPMFLVSDNEILNSDTGFTPIIPFKQGILNILKE